MEQYTVLAGLYDEYMNDVDREAWARYAMNCISRAAVGRNASVLECGCGTGAVTIPLKKAGYNVIGTDISDDMLAVAVENARKAGLLIPFVRMDMRSLSVHRPVDVVLACCDCVNYLTSPEDVRAFLRSAHDVLKIGGVLLFDVSSRYKLEYLLGNYCYNDSREDSAYLWQNNYDPESSLIEMRLEFFIRSGEACRPGEKPLYERHTETHIQRGHTQEELTAWLDEAGFASVRAFDAFTFDPPRADSERIQFFAVRAR